MDDKEILEQSQLNRYDEMINAVNFMEKDYESLDSLGIKFNSEQFLEHWNNMMENYPLLIDLFRKEDCNG